MKIKKSSILSLAIVAVLLVFLSINANSRSVDSVDTANNTDSGRSKEVATFAGGCFWCTEAVFQETVGVTSVLSGYAGGAEVNPTYEQVYKSRTGHRESVQVEYNSEIISFGELLDIYWQSIDPTDDGGQFVDRGFAYTTAVFAHNDLQKSEAEESVKALGGSGLFDRPIVTKVLDYTTFYPAEPYHQDFYQKSAARYEQYESASGREEYKQAVWESIKLDEL